MGFEAHGDPSRPVRGSLARSPGPRRRPRDTSRRDEKRFANCWERASVSSRYPTARSTGVAARCGSGRGAGRRGTRETCCRGSCNRKGRRRAWSLVRRTRRGELLDRRAFAHGPSPFDTNAVAVGNSSHLDDGWGCHGAHLLKPGNSPTFSIRSGISAPRLRTSRRANVPPSRYPAPRGHKSQFEDRGGFPKILNQRDAKDGGLSRPGTICGARSNHSSLAAARPASVSASASVRSVRARQPGART